MKKKCYLFMLILVMIGTSVFSVYAGDVFDDGPNNMYSQDFDMSEVEQNISSFEDGQNGDYSDFYNSDAKDKDIISNDADFTGQEDDLDIDCPSNVFTFEDFQVELMPSIGVKIVKYNGTEENVVVPSEILGSEVVYIGNNAFKDNLYVKSVVLPENITRIKNQAFAYCSNLSYISLPESLEQIGAYAFYNCSNLHDLILTSKLNLLGEGMIAETSINSITIPKSVKSVINENGVDGHGIQYDPAYIAGYSLKEIIFENGMTRIPDNICSGCKGLEKVIIPEGVESIGSYSFSGCVALKEVDLPESLIRIDDELFNGCTNLTDVYIKKNVTSIGNSAFANCANLTKVQILDNVEIIAENAFDSHNTNLRIYGYSDTYAMAYAEAHNIPFELLYEDEDIEVKASYHGASVDILPVEWDTPVVFTDFEVPTEQFRIYDIRPVTDEDQIAEVDEKITVELPIPENFFENRSDIYMQNPDGSWILIESKEQDGKVIFDTDLADGRYAICHRRIS